MRIKPLPQPKNGWLAWCRYPYDEDTGPAVKPHVVLIMARYHDPEIGYAVRVVYGTSQQTATGQLRTSHLLISPRDPEAFMLSRLSKPTKFKFEKKAILPWNSDWFPDDRRIPIGLLHPDMIRMAQACHRMAAASGCRVRPLAPWVTKDTSVEFGF